MIPNRFKELFLHAAQAQYQYSKQFMDTIQYTLGTLSSKEAIDSLKDDQCAICMNNESSPMLLEFKVNTDLLASLKKAH